MVSREEHFVDFHCGDFIALRRGVVEARPPVRGTPREAVRAFYTFHLAHNKDLTVRNVRLRKRWLTPDLYKLLLDELREAEARKTHPDEAPYFEGDPLTDSQEYPDSFRVGNAEVNGNWQRLP